MKRLCLAVSALSVLFLAVNSASAQSFGRYRGSVVVPHATTHYDVVPHRGHVHVVPHTTTHYHRVPAYGGFGLSVGVGYGAGYGSGYLPSYSSSYYPSYGPAYIPHTSTHIDLVPHRGHFHAVPHTTTHYHRIR